MCFPSTHQSHPRQPQIVRHSCFSICFHRQLSRDLRPAGQVVSVSDTCRIMPSRVGRRAEADALDLEADRHVHLRVEPLDAAVRARAALELVEQPAGRAAHLRPGRKERVRLHCVLQRGGSSRQSRKQLGIRGCRGRIFLTTKHQFACAQAFASPSAGVRRRM